MDPRRPKIGIAAIIIRGKQVLMGKRFSSHGSGTWSFPGGHLEWGESFEEAVSREVLEEAGLQVTSAKMVAVTNDFFPVEDRHYITIYMRVEVAHGEPENREPDKLQEWRWVVWDDMPQPVFLCVQNLLKQAYRPEDI